MESLALLMAIGALGWLFVQSRRIATLEKNLAELMWLLRAASDPEDAPNAQTSEPEARREEPWAPEKASDAAPDPVASAQPDRPTAPKAPNLGSRVVGWLAANWIYPLAGIALIFAAIYLVQYSIERNLISPTARIMLAVLLGIALSLAGEVMRRRWPAETTGLVPATLAGAGVAVLFTTPLAAFHLYDMIGQGTTLALLAVVALAAIGLGWVHGAFLSAFGVMAGAAAPFLLGEGGAPRDLLYAYFGAIGVAGLIIDGYRRWGWVSVAAVTAPLLAGTAILAAGAGDLGFVALTLILAALACATPFGKLTPDGIDAAPWPAPKLAHAPVLVAVILGGLVIGANTPLGFGAIMLPVFSAVLTLWTWRARGLAAIGAIPLGLALLFLLAPLGEFRADALIAAMNMAFPSFPYVLLGLTLLAAGLLLARRERTTATDSLAMAAPAATVVMLDLFWGQSTLSGAGNWALVCMALAALYTAVALVYARGDALRLGLAIVAAYALIALALVLMLSGTALTVALGVQMIAAVMIDRRLNLPVLALAYAAAALGLVWRIVVDPGGTALIAPPDTGGVTAVEVLLTCAVALIVPAATWVIGLGQGRDPLRGPALSVVSLTMGILIPAAVGYLFLRFAGGASAHLIFGVQAAVMIVVARVTWWRVATEQPGLTLWCYRVIGVIQGATAVVFLGVLIVPAHPVLGGVFPFADAVAGVFLINDLLLAYLLPAALLIIIARGQNGAIGSTLFGAGIALALIWVQLVVRHFWQGGASMRLSAGMGQGELYTYTVVLLILGAGFLVLAMRTGAQRFRYLSLGIIGVAACKAFLIDAAGLSGLMRVGAFLALGLSLVALAWLNGRIAGRKD